MLRVSHWALGKLHPASVGPSWPLLISVLLGWVLGPSGAWAVAAHTALCCSASGWINHPTSDSPPAMAPANSLCPAAFPGSGSLCITLGPSRELYPPTQPTAQGGSGLAERPASQLQGDLRLHCRIHHSLTSLTAPLDRLYRHHIGEGAALAHLPLEFTHLAVPSHHTCHLHCRMVQWLPRRKIHRKKKFGCSPQLVQDKCSAAGL